MTDPELIARARDADIVATAERLGVSLKRATATEWVGPCPKCGGRDRFAVNRKQQVWNCRGCAKGGADALSPVMHLRGCNFREAVDFLTDGRSMRVSQARPKLPEPKPKDEGDNRERALELWREGADPRVTVVERYLNNRELELDGDLAGEVLRWHPRIGTMIALFRNIQTGEPQAVSRPSLTVKGKSSGEGSSALYGARRSCPMRSTKCSGGCTSAKARQLGLRPCWALGSAPPSRLSLSSTASSV